MHGVQASPLGGAPHGSGERGWTIAAHYHVRAVDADADLAARHAIEEVQHVDHHVGCRRLPVVDRLDRQLDASGLRILAQLVEDGLGKAIAWNYPLLERVAPDGLVGIRGGIDAGKDDGTGHDVAAQRCGDVHP